MMTNEFLPVGPYTLPDGREFVGLSDFEVRALARDAWRRQQIADGLLAQRLAALPRPAPVKPAAKPRFVTGDLFASLPAQDQAEGGGLSRTNVREGEARTPRLQVQRGEGQVRGGAGMSSSVRGAPPARPPSSTNI